MKNKQALSQEYQYLPGTIYNLVCKFSFTDIAELIQNQLDAVISKGIANQPELSQDEMTSINYEQVSKFIDENDWLFYPPMQLGQPIARHSQSLHKALINAILTPVARDKNAISLEALSTAIDADGIIF